MNLGTLHYPTQIHMEELHRAAEHYRLGNGSRTRIGTGIKIRSAAGAWLISVGERILPLQPPGRPIATGNGGGVGGAEIGMK